VNRSEREQHFLDEIARRDKELARLRAENELLRERVDLLIRKIYGPSSEKIDPGQLGLRLDAEAAKKSDAGGGDEAAPAAEEKAAPRRKQRERCRPGLPKDIEVEEVIVDPEEVRADPEAYDYLGREVSERLEYDPERYRLRRTIRRTWVKRGEADRKPMTAPLEPCLLEGSLLSPSLPAHLLTDKFCDHLPFYRQEQILERHHDIRIGRNTMCH